MLSAVSSEHQLHKEIVCVYRLCRVVPVFWGGGVLWSQSSLREGSEVLVVTPALLATSVVT